MATETSLRGAPANGDTFSFSNSQARVPTPPPVLILPEIDHPAFKGGGSLAPGHGQHTTPGKHERRASSDLTKAGLQGHEGGPSAEGGALLGVLSGRMSRINSTMGGGGEHSRTASMGSVSSIGGRTSATHSTAGDPGEEQDLGGRGAGTLGITPPDSPLASPLTPRAPMEFLSRQWAPSNSDVDQSPLAGRAMSGVDPRLAIEGAMWDGDELGLETAPMQFADQVQSCMVLDQIMTPTQVESTHASRRSSQGYMGGPNSPNGAHLTKMGSLRLQPGASSKSVGRWWKDFKEKRKGEHRAQSARVHAAIAVAGAAAAVAAVSAATAANAADEAATKVSMAVAQAAALVAAECVEVAESLGASKDELSSVVSSAVNVKTAGDIITLTAAAATALRASATLRARTAGLTKIVPSGGQSMQHHGSMSSMAGMATPMSADGEQAGGAFSPEDSEEGASHRGSHDDKSSMGAMEEHNMRLLYSQLGKGHDVLKRSKKGELHWRRMNVYVDKHGQVACKLQKTGMLKNAKKSVVLSIEPIPAWPGRDNLDSFGNPNQETGQRHFRLITSRGAAEFEASSEVDCTMFISGTRRLLAHCAAASRPEMPDKS